MNYKINPKGDFPAYIQLYYFLREDIINGTFTYGTKIPSKRIIAAETGVSIITVEHTMELLCDEGYIETRPRSGYFVIYRNEDFQVVQTPIAGKINKLTSTSNLVEFPFSTLAKTMRKVLLDYGDSILTRSPNAGCLELRSEVCAYLARSRSIHVNPTQIVVGSGAEYLYGLIAQMFKEKGTFAIENPSYEKIKKVYEEFGITIDGLTLNQDGIDSRELKKTKAKVLHTTPFNSFPTGITANVSKKREYLNWASSKDGIIIEDNYDSELTIAQKPEDSLFLMSGGENVIYINTFSRTIAPSMRVGYMVLPQNLVKEFNQKLGFYSCTVPVFDQLVIAELLHSGDFERHLNRIRRKRRKDTK